MSCGDGVVWRPDDDAPPDSNICKLVGCGDALPDLFSLSYFSGMPAFCSLFPLDGVGGLGPIPYGGGGCCC